MKISADLILSENQWHANAALDIQGGRVIGISSAEDVDQHFSDAVIIPGFANPHSHCFQRLIRGQTEWVSAGSHDDFWSWRTAMYDASFRLTPDQLEVVAEWTFTEMLKAGITAVGEFHYLHHQPNGTPYDQVSELSQRVICAAERVGIRITHLPVAYARGGFKRSTTTQQRRFINESPEQFLSIVEELKQLYDSHPTINIGLAPHSVRAVDIAWLNACGQAAKDWNMPIHIHACEQPRELIECNAEHGCTPIELLAAHHILHERATVVHATHLSKSDVDLISETKSIVCACPTTEANLGDGFVPSRELLTQGVRIALGTDSHAQIDLFQEARLVDMQARLLTQARNPLAQFTPTNSTQLKTSDVLWPMMTTNGYASLGLHGGTLAPGSLADFIVLDRHHASCFGTRKSDLLSSLILAGQPDMVKAVYVNGEPVIHDGRARTESATRQRYLETFKTLYQET